jgi:hypothetical protein
LFPRLIVVIDLLRSNRCGQEHAETGTAAGPAVDLDATAMCENDGLADGQPETVAGHLRLPRRLVADERLENALAILRGDTWPLVLYREHQFAILSDPSRDTDCGACRRVFDRVLDEIREHALHLTRIHPN